MRRTDRLFEIIQILRNENHKPLTASEIAERLEVSTRTVYRDIQALQAMRTPIEGEAGVGYMMRRGYDLPPINFTVEEVEAIVVGLNLLSRTGDIGLQKAAAQVINKLESVRERLDSFQVSDWGTSAPKTVDPTLLREAIREEQKLHLHYCDEKQQQTQRTVLPIAMIYYIESIVLVAWCELREEFRSFRVDRILGCEFGEVFFKGKGDKMREEWQKIKNC